MRRGGARREVTERVSLRFEDGRALEGWALNVSRGGLRAILEEKVILGQKLDVAVGSDQTVLRRGRIVWVQEEPDGVIVGIEFTGLSGLHRSVPPAPLGSETASETPPRVAAEAVAQPSGPAPGPALRDDESPPSKR